MAGDVFFSCVMDGFYFMEIRRQKRVLLFSFLAHKELSLEMDWRGETVGERLSL